MSGGRRRIWFLLPAGVMIGGLVMLGFWQLDRLAWKNALETDLHERLTGAPVTVPHRGDDLDALVFRRVREVGRFMGSRDLRLMSRTRDGKVGIEILTPFALDDGTFVIVNRGWVPDELAGGDRSIRPWAVSERPFPLEGVVRVPEQPNMFRPDNDPEDDEWYVYDLDEMAEAMRLDKDLVRPVWISMTAPPAPDGLPVRNTPEIRLRNDHLQYALTWFSLAAIGVVMSLFFVFGRRRPGE